jgi:NMD protein affecting ribosome stability and mRNA decay
MRTYECRRCGANCDPGELRRGLCEDCTETAEKEKTMEHKVEMMLNATFIQMVMEEMI